MKNPVISASHPFFLLFLGLLLVPFDAVPVSAKSSYSLSLYAGFDVDETMTHFDPRVLLVKFGDDALFQVAEPDAPSLDFGADADLSFSFDNTGGGQLVLEAVNPDVQLVLLADTDFDAVDDSWLAGLDPNAGLTEVPVDPADTLLVCVNGGCVKLGGILLDPASGTVSFKYERLTAIPEPAGLALFALGLLGALFTLTRRRTTR